MTDPSEYKESSEYKEASDYKEQPDLFEKIEGESTGLGGILSRIPGFGGYIERSRRREADQLLRAHLARLVENVRRRLGHVQEEMAGDIAEAIVHAEPLGRVDSCLAGLAGKIRDAPTGYAGFFDAVKIREAELAGIYEFDESMLYNIDVIDAALLKLEEASSGAGDVEAAVRELQRACQEAMAAFDRRQDLLMGIG